MEDIMSKSILIGNGFTSELIKDYSNIIMKEKLIKYFNNEYYNINNLFNNFRMTNYSDKDVYRYDGGLRCSENLFPGEHVYPQADRILYNEKIKVHVINVLKDIGFQDYNEIYDTYFIQYGLIFEVIKSEVYSIESLLKVANMFKKIGKINDEKENELKFIANKIYYNDGECGLKDTNLNDYTKIKEFFQDFDFVFTTNYDLILDDICENEDKVYHLHGGFNIRKVSEPGKVYYIKTDEKLNDKEAHIIWGINGEDKIKYMEAGMTFPVMFPLTIPTSLFHEYFDILEKENINEIHIFGYSGENDQHINKRICNNKNIRTIYFYCDPEKISNYNYKCKIKELFENTKAKIIFEPWTKIWTWIR